VGTVWPYLMSLKDYSHFHVETRRRINNDLNSKIQHTDIENIRLQDFLLLTDGFEAFLSYLESEFNSENLLLWREVFEYQKLPVTDPDTIKNRAIEIHKDFIVRGAPFEMNIGVR